jgi:hypothetical protein
VRAVNLDARSSMTSSAKTWFKFITSARITVRCCFRGSAGSTSCFGVLNSKNFYAPRYSCAERSVLFILFLPAESERRHHSRPDDHYPGPHQQLHELEELAQLKPEWEVRREDEGMVVSLHCCGGVVEGEELVRLCDLSLDSIENTIALLAWSFVTSEQDIRSKILVFAEEQRST